MREECSTVSLQKLLIITPDADEYRAYITRALPQLDIAIAPDDDADAAKALAGQADMLLAWNFPPDLLAEAPRLRWVQSFGAGVDHLLGARIPPGVTITRVVDAFGPAMAEYVLGYCYATTLDVRRILEQQRRAEWKPFNATLLAGKTAVVVGLGNIGRPVCRLLGAAGLRVLGVSRGGQPAPETERTFKVDELDRVLPRADFLVLVLPLTPATRGLIGANQLALLPQHAWLINVARGPVVVEADLLAALERGSLAGAVLDVFEQEPLPPEHPFWRMDTVIVTPHLAGPDEVATVAERFVDNYRRLQAGQPLRGVVDRSRGY
jgi:glyoxylate/hydroxypyruvate reductase A